MRCFLVWARRRLMGTVVAPSDMDASFLVVAMYGSETRIARAEDADPDERYGALCVDQGADYGGFETLTDFNARRIV